MSIFGQVWLWRLAAFFVGVLLTWLVLVLPLRKSVRKLETSLAPAGSHPDPDDAFRPQPEPDGRASETQFLTPVAEPEDDDPYRSAASDYLAPEDEPEPATPALSRLEQPLGPEPAAGSLFRPPAEETRAPAPDWFDHAPPSERSAFEEP